MQFQHPYYFLMALALLPMGLLYVRYLRWKKERIRRIGEMVLVETLTKSYSRRNFSIRIALTGIAFILLVTALATLRKPQGGDTVRRNGMDVMIALDVSRSMLAQDVQPSRLDRAKQLLYRLIDKLPDDRIGMVVFAGKAYLQLPLTTDHAAAKMYIASLSTEAVPTQGTVFNEALKMSYSGFNTADKKYRAIVLVSDGEDHDEDAEKTARLLAGEGVLINTVGIGSAEGTQIYDPATGTPKLDAAGNPVITRINEDLLRKIALTTGGVYTHFSSAEATAGTLQGQLQTMERRSVTDTAFSVYSHYFQWFLAAGLLLLLLSFLIPEYPRGNLRQQTALLIFLALAGLPAGAQEARDLIRQGNTSYDQQRYSEAAAAYRKAVTDREQQGTALYNLGNALYKDNQHEEALQAYSDAVSAGGTNSEKAAAWYNKGVVFQQQKKLPDCIAAYKNALRLNPGDAEARINLQQALRQQQQQQQKQQPQPPKKQQQKPDQQPQKQQQPPPPRISKKEAEEKLRALMQHEKNLQEKLRKVPAGVPEKPEKDW